MIKKIVGFSGCRLLSNAEQVLILGGQKPLRMCNPDGTCEAGFCCKGGVCIDDTPGPDGKIPACDMD